MRTACTHCGTPFDVPDKTLGKQARCKSCGKMFVLMPAEAEAEIQLQEITPPRRSGSTSRLAAVGRDEYVSDDPLDALAGAAEQSGADMRPVHGRSTSSRRDEYDDDRPRRRMAKGAQAAMSLGITSTVLTVIGGVCGIIAMVKASNQSLLITLGLIAVGLIAVGAVLSMMAVANGTTAMKHIRQARHPMDGKNQASTGTLFGWISLAIVFIAIIAGGIWLSKRGGIVFEKEIGPEPPPRAPQAPAAPSTE